MKNILLLVLVIGAFANAQSLLTENFDYTADGTNGLATQSSNLWNKVNTGDSILVTSSSLSYSGITSSGNKIAFAGVGTDYWRSFTSQTAGSTVYYSFLLNVTSLGSLDATGGYFTSVMQDASTTAFGATVWLRLDGSGYNIGVTKRTTVGNVVYTSGTRSLNTTYLVVVSYQLNSGTTTDDVVKIWVNPATGLASEPTADATSTSTDTDLTSVARVLLRQDSATETPSIEMDEITISTSWADAGLPVELTSFTAIAKGRGVELAWKTASEVNNAGFEIERNVNGSWNKIGYVEGNGTTNAPKSYNYTDASAKGTVSYRLKQVDNDGKFEYSNVVEVAAGITAADYELSQNFPNPFNPNTNITFAMKNAEHVNVTVYNSLGQAVATLFNDVASANQIYTLNFDGKNLSSGTYFYSLRSATRNEVRKMSMMK
jgi:hypothetical protein